MSRYSIVVTDSSEYLVNVDTDGYIILYLDETGSIKTTGKIETSALTPILAKTLLSKMSKGS